MFDVLRASDDFVAMLPAIKRSNVEHLPVDMVPEFAERASVTYEHPRDVVGEGSRVYVLDLAVAYDIGAAAKEFLQLFGLFLVEPKIVL